MQFKYCIFCPEPLDDDRLLLVHVIADHPADYLKLRSGPWDDFVEKLPAIKGTPIEKIVRGRSPSPCPPTIYEVEEIEVEPTSHKVETRPTTHEIEKVEPGMQPKTHDVKEPEVEATVHEVEEVESEEPAVQTVVSVID